MFPTVYYRLAVTRPIKPLLITTIAAVLLVGSAT